MIDGEVNLKIFIFIIFYQIVLNVIYTYQRNTNTLF